LRRPGRQLLRSWYMAFFQVPWLPERFMSAGDYRSLDRMFGELMPEEEVEAYKAAFKEPGALKATIDYYRTAFRGQFGDMIRRKNQEFPLIEAPTLLIWGTDDVALGIETTDATEKWVPNLRKEFIDGASHWVNQERPDEVNRLMLDFLADVPPKA
jgi:epoxide hydrolase 4